jgi:carbamate kinase
MPVSLSKEALAAGGDPSFAGRPLLVLALGGNALSPPTAGHRADDYGPEREIVSGTAHVLDGLIQAGLRLLIVHGNGPQVGRLLQSDPVRGNLDIHVAQTQGELGYLLIAALRDLPAVCLLTRAVVTESLGEPVKPVGPLLAQIPPGQSGMRSAAGWRITVPSPRPARIVESSAIATLLRTHHVVAGGGGGVPVDGLGRPLNCVVDKDWVASLLAVALGAQHLVFATDVDGVYEKYGAAGARLITRLDPARARAMIEAGQVAPGSMAPKLASAADFAIATGRPARICGLGAVAAAMSGTSDAGTLVTS